MLCHALAVLAVLASTARADTLDPNFYSVSWEEVCAQGKSQTPIDLEYFYSKDMPEQLVTDLVFPTVSGVKLVNTGTALKVEWDSLDEDSLPKVPVAGNAISDLIVDPTLVPTKKVRVQPAQFHFHSTSEHLVEGLYAAAELHIVAFIAKGEAPEWGCDEVWDGGDPNLEKCTAVFGVLYKLGESSPPWMDAMFAQAPKVVDEDDYKPFSQKTFDLGIIMPEDHSYWGYSGSLTTPPCAEGLRWHVFRQEPTITIDTLKLMTDWLASSVDKAGTQAVSRTNHRLPQAINKRNLFFWEDPDAPPVVRSGCEGSPGVQPSSADGGYGDSGSNRRLFNFW